MTAAGATWLVLSDRTSDEHGQAQPEILACGTFVMEFALPLEGPTVLLDYQAADGWPRTFALFHDPGTGLALMHRQGQQVVRHSLTAELRQTSGTARLSYRFDAPQRHWQMRLDLFSGNETVTLSEAGTNPLPLRPADIMALSLPPFRANRHPSVLWFGLTDGERLPDRAPWIGQRSPVETAKGPVAAGHLQPGDLVWTADGGLLPLRRIERLVLPSCGSFAPVILRSPYFGASHDILVSADQMVMLSGPEVEYLFDESDVLIEAGALVDGKTALSDQRRAITAVLRLEFDFPATILVDGCRLASCPPGRVPAQRVLQGYEVLTLMALLGRAGNRRVA